MSGVNIEALKAELESIVSCFEGGDETYFGEYCLAKRLLDNYFEPPKPKKGEIWAHYSGLYVTYLNDTSGVVLKTERKSQKVGEIIDDLSILSYPKDWKKVESIS